MTEPQNHVESTIRRLLDEGVTPRAIMEALRAQGPEENRATEAEIAAARARYAIPSHDDIEIDDDAMAARGADEDDRDAGAWIAAWVFVRPEDMP